MATIQPRQESHRIYLQQPKNPSNTDTNSKEGCPISTSSAAIRLTSVATCRDVTQLLRKKFCLPPLATVSTKEEGGDVIPSLPLVNRIQAHLEKVRGNGSLVDKAAKNNWEGIKQYDSTSDDALVLVVTCFSMPQGYINFNNLAKDIVKPRVFDSSRWAFSSTSTSAPTQNLSISHEKVTVAPSNPLKDVEPINIVQTIMPHENPLQVKDVMMNYVLKLQMDAELEMEVRDSIVGGKILRKKSPIIRWFFMPCHIDTSTTSQKVDSSDKNCVRYIELEGYCTDAFTDSDGCSSDDSDDDDDDEETELRARDVNIKKKASLNWKRKVLPYADYDRKFSADKNSSSMINRKRLQRERHRLAILSRFEASLESCCVSGYLLKQSRRDEHVWKQVRCVLNDDQFWYVGRETNIDRHISPLQDGTGKRPLMSSRIGKHTIVCLKGALLHLSMDKKLALSSTPYIFELMTESGTSHIFRALNLRMYLRWTQCLSERVERCHDNASFDLADLIASGEAFAKGKRCEDALLKPAFASLVESKQLSPYMSHEDVHAEKVHNITCFAIGIAEYKELCRRIQHSTAAGVRVPIVNTRSQTKEEEQCLSSEDAVLSEEAREKEQYLQSMTRSAWSMAGSLIKQSYRLLPAFAHCQNTIQLCQKEVQYQIDEFYQDKLYIPAADGNITSVSPAFNLFDPLFNAVAGNLNLGDSIA